MTASRFTLTHPSRPRSRGHAVRYLCVAAAVLLAGTLAVSPSDAAHGAPSGALLSTVTKAKPAPAQSTRGGIINTLARASFRSTFGGVVFSESGKKPTIYLTRLDPAAMRAFTALPLDRKPSFRLAPHTWSDQLALVDRLAADHASLAREGVRLQRWYPDAARGRVQVEILGSTKSASASTALAHSKQLLNHRYGDLLTVTAVARASSEDAHFTGRADDTAPWNGGDFISGSGCTSGFGMRSTANGQDFLATAAHCYSEIGYLVRNHTGDGFSPGIGTNIGMGVVAYIDTATNGQDVALIRTENYGGSNNKIWGGSTSAPFRRTVTGWGDVAMNEVVQTIGAYEGESTALVVTGVHQCMTVGGRGICGISRAVSQFGKIAVGAGDSGGPVWNNNGGVKAVGTISFGFGTRSTCPNYSVGYTPRYCYTGVGFTDIGSTMSQWGIAPVL